jgi:hypothetical protein
VLFARFAEYYPALTVGFQLRIGAQWAASQYRSGKSSAQNGSILYGNWTQGLCGVSELSAMALHAEPQLELKGTAELIILDCLGCLL